MQVEKKIHAFIYTMFLSTQFQNYGNFSGYKCPTCEKIYKLKQSLVKHMKFECQKEPKFKCPYCEHRSKLKYNLKKHIITVHKIIFQQSEIF